MLLVVFGRRIPVATIIAAGLLLTCTHRRMGDIFRFLGLSVGCLPEFAALQQRRQLISTDVVYATGPALAFAFLWDNHHTKQAADIVSPSDQALDCLILVPSHFCKAMRLQHSAVLVCRVLSSCCMTAESARPSMSRSVSMPCVLWPDGKVKHRYSTEGL